MSLSEGVLLVIVALVVFSPKRLPQLAQDLGRFFQKARSILEAIKFQLTLPEREAQLRLHTLKAEAIESDESDKH